MDAITYLENQLKIAKELQASLTEILLIENLINGIKKSIPMQLPVMQKAVEDEEREYSELFNELNKNFTAYNWFITTKPNSDEAKKRWDKIREIINRFSA